MAKSEYIKLIFIIVIKYNIKPGLVKGLLEFKKYIYFFFQVSYQPETKSDVFVFTNKKTIFNDNLETYYDFQLLNLQPSTDYIIKLKIFNSVGFNITQIVRKTDEKRKLFFISLINPI